MKKGAYSTSKGDAYVKERLVICNEEDTDGRARMSYFVLKRSFFNI